MTDPAPEAVRPVAAPVSPVDAAAAAIAVLLADAYRLLPAYANNPDALAAAIVQLQSIERETRLVRNEVERLCHDVMAASRERSRPVPGVGMLRIDSGDNRSGWQHAEIAAAVLAAPSVVAEIAAAVDTAVAAGSVDHPHDLIRPVSRATAAILLRHLTPAGWRVGMRRAGVDWRVKAAVAPPEVWDGGLRSLGIQPDQYCRTSKRRSATVTR